MVSANSVDVDVVFYESLQVQVRLNQDGTIRIKDADKVAGYLRRWENAAKVNKDPRRLALASGLYEDKAQDSEDDTPLVQRKK